jgi:hypothetical protein
MERDLWIAGRCDLGGSLLSEGHGGLKGGAQVYRCVCCFAGAFAGCKDVSTDRHCPRLKPFREDERVS